MLASGSVSDQVTRDMHREGHTIKGTARMMGFHAVSDAGKLLEDVWRSIGEGTQLVPPDLASALERLAAELVPAIEADPETGTPGLAAGVRALRTAIGAPTPPEPADQSPATGLEAPDDLGGLLGTLGSWDFGENVRVDAAGLYRLINEVSALRMDAETLHTALDQVNGAIGDQRALRVALGRLEALFRRAEAAIVALQDRAVELSAAPLSEITSTFPQLVRYLARTAHKDVRLELVGDHHSVDRQVLEALGDPLRQLIVNAIEHGIEPADVREAEGKPRTGTLAIRFEVVDHRLTAVVEDDGAGVNWAAVRIAAAEQGLAPPGVLADPETLRSLLFAHGFSTRSDGGDPAGDGMGLSTVAQAVETLHGTVVLDSETGSGSRVVITVPTIRALQDAVLFRAAGQTWGIPELAVLERVPMVAAELSAGQARLEMAWRGMVVPVAPFADAVGLQDSSDDTTILVVSSPVGPVGLSVAEDLGRRQVAARQLGPVLDGVSHLTGAALLGGGDVAVLVDAARLAEKVRGVAPVGGERHRVLVVDDSLGARQIVGGALGSAGFTVELAGSPTEALSVLADEEFDAIVLDYVLPTTNGAVLAGQIRALGIEAPIVLLSGVATAADRARAIEAGANACLDKDDVRQGALADALRGLIGRESLAAAS